MDAMEAARMIRGVQSAFQFLTILNLTDYMYPPQADVEKFPYYDFIVVGGGTAGCVVASRLAEDRKTQVLLIEAGGNPPIQSILPATLVYQNKSPVNWNYAINDTRSVTCRQCSSNILAIGKVLGGSSTVNYLIYSEGGKKDYDNWATIVNDSSWDGNSVLPYFIKSQRLEDPIIEASSDGEYYGRDGPMIITKDRSQDAQRILTGFEEADFNVREDTNIENPVGFTAALYNLGNGVRQDSATTYLSPKKEFSNLHVLRNALATKILFNKSKKAVTVEVSLNNKILKIKAKLEVIVSAGALNTPKLLMLSGIGPKKDLERKGIKVIADLPVGKNLQHQLGTFLVTRLKNTSRKPPYSNPHEHAPVVTGHVSLDNSRDQPDYLALNYIGYASRHAIFANLAYQFNNDIINTLFSPRGKYRSSDSNQNMVTVISNLNMKTRGVVSLRGTDYNKQPHINVSKYYDNSDLDNQVKYIQDFIRVLDTPSFKEMGAEFLAPELEDCDDLEKYSTEYWYCYAKCMASIRPLFGGSTAMGTVTDIRLRVKGIKGLRVVDAGVMPVLPRTVLLGPTVMIAEKAADMIKEDNGL